LFDETEVNRCAWHKMALIGALNTGALKHWPSWLFIRTVC